MTRGGATALLVVLLAAAAGSASAYYCSAGYYITSEWLGVRRGRVAVNSAPHPRAKLFASPCGPNDHLVCACRHNVLVLPLLLVLVRWCCLLLGALV